MSALRHLRRARKADPARAESYLAEAELWLENEDYDGAETAARQGLVAAVREPNLLIRLGQALAGQGRLEDARAYYERFLAERPRDIAARRALAAVLAAEVNPSLFQRSPDVRVNRPLQSSPDRDGQFCEGTGLRIKGTGALTLGTELLVCVQNARVSFLLLLVPAWNLAHAALRGNSTACR